MPELTVGSKAPDINLLDDEGKPFKLSALKGKTVVLYFYPKADTPGCTTESCQFRDADSKILKKGAVVVGISPDTPKSQEKFKTKFSLPTVVQDVVNTFKAIHWPTPVEILRSLLAVFVISVVCMVV